jgi:ATP-dependent RNA helicase DHX37/DHR1
MDEEVQDILSKELKAELGGDDDSILVVPSRSIKRDRSKEIQIIPEILEEAKQISKRAKKKIEQLNLKKEKESKRDYYYDLLKKNDLSVEHHQLMLSSKEIGQTSSLKETLKNIFKKHKAGLKLSTEENELLFPSGGNDESNIRISEINNIRLNNGESEEIDPKMKVKAPTMVMSSGFVIEKLSCNIEKDDKQEVDSRFNINKLNSNKSDKNIVDTANEIIDKPKTLLVNMDDMFSVDDDKDDNVREKKKKEKRKRKSKVDDNINNNDNVQAVEVIKPVEEKLTIGQKLMLQLKSLKTQAGITSVLDNHTIAKTTREKENINKLVPTVLSSGTKWENTDSDDENKDKTLDKGTVLITASQRIASSGNGIDIDQKYNPLELDMPIDNKGIINIDLNTGNSNNDDIKYRKLLSKCVSVTRDDSIQATRLLLPVCGMEQEIVETIQMNDVVILCGETGSGKSTQVPQFLYEMGFGKEGIIGITQPRRVAATSTAIRVATELSDTCHKGDGCGVVGYQIRFDSSTVGENTQIKFMTDGILLKEVTGDLLLKKYSVILLDEAHERNINTDVLLGMISRTLPLRKAQSDLEMGKWNNLTDEQKLTYKEPLKPLKLVIMSATMRVDDFKNPILFPSPPPVIKVDARQYNVVTHFNKRTELKSYLNETHKKVCQIHRRLPDGAILVFLTGKREILYMCNKISRSLNRKSLNKTKVEIVGDLDHLDANDLDENDENNKLDRNIRGLDDDEVEGDANDVDGQDDISDIEDDYDDEEEDSDVDGNESDDDDDDDDNNNNNNNVDNDESNTILTDIEKEEKETRENMLREALGLGPISPTLDKDTTTGILSSHSEEVMNSDELDKKPQKVYVLPLYAMMPTAQQNRVFLKPPEGHRLIVVATNVAETSITIPGVRYVVDCGRQKERVNNIASGINKFEVKWISKAAAEQRKGRAGRTGPGHCYRLYSSAYFDQHMEMFAAPEISMTPLEELLLQMRSLGISDVENFPFPSPPPPLAVKRAKELLVNLGAISTKKSLLRGNLTELGQLLSKFPINPRFSKMLVIAHKSGVLNHALSLVSVLVEKSPFIMLDKKAEMKKTCFGNSDSDTDSDSDSDINDNDKNMHNSHLSWHPEGDSLARLRTMGAYIFANENLIKLQKKQKKMELKKQNNSKIEKFTFESPVIKLCNTQALQLTTLQKSYELREQLVQICSRIFFNKDDDMNEINRQLTISSNVPTSDEETALKQVLITGSCDSIARRAAPGIIRVGSRRMRLTAYFSCNPNIVEPLYIHPHSSVFKKDPAALLPEYVAYGPLIKNLKGDMTYMTCVTSVNPSWISTLASDCPLLQWDSPLSSPSPYYDHDTNQITCYVMPKFGVHNWELPPVARSMQSCINRDEKKDSDISGVVGYRKKDEAYRWFAKLLLDGGIGLNLKGILSRDKLKEPSSIITNMKPSVKVSNLLRALVQSKVQNKITLLEKIKKNKNFLNEEIQEFLVVDARKAFRKAWSQL